MRLTLLTHFPGRGGSTGFMVQMRDFFLARGHEVALVVGDDAPDSVTSEYTVVPRTPNQTWRERMAAYVQAIEKTRPDLVYAISGQDEFEVLRFLRHPRALQCGCIERHDYADIPLWFRQLEPYTELRTVHTPDLIWTVKGNPALGIQVFLALQSFSPIFHSAPDINPAAAQKPGGGEVEVCYLSRLEKYQKRSHWLPEIIDICQRSGAKLNWHIYGTGPAEEEVRAGVKQRGVESRVTFHGWQSPETIAQRLPQHDLFFLCSRWEGMPAAMVEAMLCGLACLVPYFPAGMPYMVESGGGWVYDATSPAACARAVLGAVSDREALARRRREAQEVARRRYDPERVETELTRLDAALRALKFNGRVESLEQARRMRLVGWRALLRRKVLEWTGRPPNR